MLRVITNAISSVNTNPRLPTTIRLRRSWSGNARATSLSCSKIRYMSDIGTGTPAITWDAIPRSAAGSCSMITLSLASIADLTSG